MGVLCNELRCLFECGKPVIQFNWYLLLREEMDTKIRETQESMCDHKGREASSPLRDSEGTGPTRSSYWTFDLQNLKAIYCYYIKPCPYCGGLLQQP